VKILFLSHYFPPEVNAPASRTYEHCRQWVEMGHDVTVVTCAPNHPRGELYEGYSNKLVQREVIDGISVIRLWTYVTANERVLKRTLNYLSYMLAVIAAAPFLPSADVVLSTSPQFFNGLAGYFVGHLKRAPWVLEIRDLWPESIVAVGAIRNRWIIGSLRWIERFAYRHADAIVSVTGAFRQYMVEMNIPAEKIAVIPNGVDLDFYRPDDLEIRPIQEPGLSGKFVASYFGTLGMAHHLETIMEAARLLRHRNDVVFLIVGDGAERDKLQRLRDDAALDNVIMLEQQPKSRMPYWWQCSSASMVLLRKSDLFKKVIPSKIFESMAMRKPIVLGVEGESREIVAAAGAGVCISPESACELAKRIVDLAGDPGWCEVLGRNGRQYVGEHYDRRVLAAQYEALLHALACKSAPQRRSGPA